MLNRVSFAPSLFKLADAAFSDDEDTSCTTNDFMHYPTSCLLRTMDEMRLRRHRVCVRISVFGRGDSQHPFPISASRFLAFRFLVLLDFGVQIKNNTSKYDVLKF